MTEEISPRSRLVVTLLSGFLGVFGAHRFYLGKTGTALLMLFTFGGLGIWATVDFIFAVAGIMRDKDGRLIKNWEESPKASSAAVDIARGRYARGEITKKEYEQMKKDLEES